MILGPGVHDGVPSNAYHLDPVEGGSLSSSDVRALLQSPARYRHNKDHGRPPTDAFDFGHLAHLLVLGEGEAIEVIDAKDWRTKAAKEARDEARAAGRTPVLAAQHETAKRMADTVHESPIAAALLDRDRGRAEVTVIAPDPDHPITRRCRTDWWLDDDAPGPILIDYKTTDDVSERAIARSAHNYGYHQQEAWYADTIAAALGIDPTEVRFAFIFQEKNPPFLVHTVALPPRARALGRRLNTRAVGLYLAATEANEWPGPGDPNRVNTVDLPTYAYRQ